MKFNELNEGAAIKFKKVLIEKNGNKVSLDAKEIASILDTINTSWHPALSMININNAIRRLTYGVLKYGDHPTDLMIYPGGAVALRYDSAGCFVYLIP